ncbi:MAG: hypothetical protein V1740_03620 [Candidatus Woesearchaeota archaeon]
MGHMCSKCGKLCALLVLVLGVLFLLQDLKVWNFWNISWYTILFLLMAICMFCKGYCPTCKTEGKAESKKK